MAPSSADAVMIRWIYAHRRAVGWLFNLVATSWACATAYLLRFDLSWPRLYVGLSNQSWIEVSVSTNSPTAA